MSEPKANTVSDTPRTDSYFFATATKDQNHWAAFAREIERELTAMTKERDGWRTLAAQYSSEREHNAMKALEYQAERDEWKQRAITNEQGETAERDNCGKLRARVAELEEQLKPITP